MSRGVYVLEANRWRALSILNVSIRETSMKTPPLDPEVSDTAPEAAFLTPYDEEHLITYLRLLDAQNDGAVWEEVARIVLHIDPEEEPRSEEHTSELQSLMRISYAVFCLKKKKNKKQIKKK